MNKTAKQWVSPTLVVKPLEETRAGRGLMNDGLHELQS